MCSRWAIAVPGTYTVALDGQSKASFSVIVYGARYYGAFLYSAAFELRQLYDDAGDCEY